jgi:hypothetical protein
MFPDLSKFTDPEKLRRLAANAERLGHNDYAAKCRIRIAELAGLQYDNALEREFWEAVTCAEEFKTAENGKTTRLARTRQKHKRVGAHQCLVDWAFDPKTTDGFHILLASGRPDLTAEAIVVRHPDKFPSEAVAAAELKLSANGVTREQVLRGGTP